MRAVIQHWLQVAGFGEKKNKVGRMKKKENKLLPFFNCLQFQKLSLVFCVRDEFPGCQKYIYYQWVGGQRIFSNIHITHLVGWLLSGTGLSVGIDSPCL